MIKCCIFNNETYKKALKLLKQGQRIISISKYTPRIDEILNKLREQFPEKTIRKGRHSSGIKTLAQLRKNIRKKRNKLYKSVHKISIHRFLFEVDRDNKAIYGSEYKYKGVHKRKKRQS